MPRRTVLSTLASLALLVVLSAPMGAEFEVQESGNVGDWNANDSEVAPGATCKYNSSFRLVKLSARPPVVFSFRPGGQKVGWQLRVVRNYQLPNNDQYADQLVYKSTFQKDRATLSEPADFTRKAWTVEGPTSGSTRYKVWVYIRLYRPNGTVEGTVRYRYEWFRQTGSADKVGMDFFCYRSPF